MKTQLQKGGKLQADTPEERFKKMVEEKKQAIMNKNMAGGNNSMKMHLPGTKPPEEGKGLSKSAQKILALMAEKKARKEAKKAAAAVAIKTKYFSNGGKLDANGNLYNAAGKIIGKVDGKTGVIKSSWGANLGKYSDSSAGDYKLSRIVEVAREVWG